MTVNRKLTIIMTNYIDTRPASTEETLEDKIGVRLRSRLYEMCKTLSSKAKIIECASILITGSAALLWVNVNPLTINLEFPH